MEEVKIFREFKTILSAYVPATAAKAFENLHGQTSMGVDLGVESPGIISMVTSIENKFNIEIDNDSIRRISTVESCISLIREKLSTHYIPLQAI